MGRLLTRAHGPSTEPETHSMADLLELVAIGQSDAFRELYGRLSPNVFKLSQAILRDVSHAEEVTQEVFLETWQRAANFDRARGSATSWVMRIAHSRSVDRVRQAQTSRIRDGKYSFREFELDVDSVVDHVMRTVDHDRVHAALTELSALQNEALTLTFLVGHSYREASDLLGVPLATLKTRVRDGIVALRRADSRLTA